MEKKKELVRQTDVDEIIDGLVGIVLTKLSGMRRGARATCRSGATSTE